MALLPGLGAQSDPAKWNMPGWKVERRYSDRVLVHNWLEESYETSRMRAGVAKPPAPSDKRRSVAASGTADVVVRRRWQPSNPHPGLTRATLFGHAGTAGADPAASLVTWYDGDYNRRGERPAEQRLPELRRWDSKTLSWRPEKSDHPVQGAPTTWGLASDRERRLRRHREDGLDLGLGARRQPTTTYAAHYWPKQPDESAVRYGVPRDLVTTLREYGRAAVQRDDGVLRNVPVTCNGGSGTGGGSGPWPMSPAAGRSLP